MDTPEIKEIRERHEADSKVLDEYKTEQSNLRHLRLMVDQDTLFLSYQEKQWGVTLSVGDPRYDELIQLIQKWIHQGSVDEAAK